MRIVNWSWLRAPAVTWPQRLFMNKSVCGQWLARVIASVGFCLLAATLPVLAQPHAPLNYHGGPVMNSFEIYPVYYGNWSSTDINNHQSFLKGLAGFISGQDAPAGMQPVMAQYNVNSASVAPPITTLAPVFSTTSLADGDIQKIIHTNQSSGKIPAYQSNRLIMVFLPGGYTVQITGGCAYHGAESPSAIYSAVPKDCGPTLQLVTGHEVFEAAADPSFTAWDEAVDGCKTVINLEFGAIPGPADNTQGGTCSSTGFIGTYQYQGISGQSQVVARMPGHLDVFWIDPVGAVWSNWWDNNVNSGRWNTPFTIAPAGSAAPGTVTVASRNPGHLDVFWVGNDGSVMSNWWDAGFNNGYWNTPFVVAPPKSALPSKIAAVGRAANHVDVFWIAPDGSVWTNFWDGFGGGPWATPFEIARAGSAQPGMIAAVSRMPGQVDVFWIDLNGGVISNFWNENFNNGNWNTPYAIAGPNSALAGGITATARMPGHLDVFWIAPDLSVRTNYWDVSGTWGTPFSIAGPNSALPGAITAVGRVPNHLDVFWTSAMQQVFTNAWDASSGWAAKPWSVTGVQQGRPSLLSVVGRQPDQLDLFSVDYSGSVLTTFWNPSNNWPAPFAISGGSSALSPDFTQPPRPGSWAESRDNTRIDVFWGATDGSILNNVSYFGTWLTAPVSVAPAGTTLASAPVTGISRHEYHTDLYWSSPGADVMIQSSDRFFNNFSWGGAFPIAFSSTATSPVSAISRNPNHIDVFWTSPKGEVKSNFWDAFMNNNKWNSDYDVCLPNCAVPGSPVSAVTRSAGHVDIFWASSSGTVMTNQWEASVGWDFSRVIAGAGSVPAGAPVSAVTRNAFHVDIFWVNSKGAVMSAGKDSFTNSGQWGNPYQIAPPGSAVPGTTVAAVSRIPYQVDVFWQTSGGAIMSTLWNQFEFSGQWITPYQVAPSGSAEAMSPLAAVSDQPNHLAVFWMYSAGSVTGTYWDQFANNGWTSPSSLMAPPIGGGGGGAGGGGGGGGHCNPCHQ
jgi:hypothetical protein